MVEEIALGASIGSLAIAGFTMWATLFRSGAVRMTHPTVIYFGPDGGRERKRKVFLRTLLYTTGNKGRIIEGMFVTLRHGESSQAFNIWVYGEKELRRGSGLRIGPEGIAFDHHFLLPENAGSFEFLPGQYHAEVFALVLGEKRPRSLFTTRLSLSEQQAAAIHGGKSGVYFDWSPNAQVYHASVRNSQLRSELVEEMLEESLFKVRTLP